MMSWVFFHHKCHLAMPPSRDTRVCTHHTHAHTCTHMHSQACTAPTHTHTKSDHLPHYQPSEVPATRREKVANGTLPSSAGSGRQLTPVHSLICKLRIGGPRLAQNVSSRWEAGRATLSVRPKLRTHTAQHILPVKHRRV